MEALLPLVYDELRALASHYLVRERAHTLQPTALVHEAYMKMAGADRGWTGRDHFLAVAARAMRQVLVDHARARKTDKRGGDARRVDLSIELSQRDMDGRRPGKAESSREMRVLELNDLLDELCRTAARPARVAEMRLFGGMEAEQIATVLGISRMTVTRDWQIARAWLAAKVQDIGRE